MRNDKIVLTSKSRLDTKVCQRRPVKECYCISEIPERAEPPDGRERGKNVCGPGPEDPAQIYCSRSAETDRNSLVATLLGYETLRRAGRITYLPNSEFLRRVQRKIQCHGRTRPSGASSGVSSSGSSGQDGGETSGTRRATPAEIGGSERSGKKGETTDMTKNDGNGSSGESRRWRSLENATKARGTEKKGEKQGKGKAKGAGDKGRSRKVVRTISTHGRCCNRLGKGDSGQATRGQSLESEKRELRVSSGEDCVCRVCGSGEARWRLSRDRARPEESEERVKELSKFRRANYFETHGSVDTLVGSSRSSLLRIDPCELNDRFFAPAEASAGKNIKRIHYYPSYVVREEKQMDDTRSENKMRSRNSCDAIGHVIDLGVLKIPCHFSHNFYFNSHKRRSHQHE